MSVLNQSGEEQVECPLCMEPLEVDDLNFYPCTCGYQICRFCWHRIRTDENGLCPACRKAYSEDPADFIPLSQEQVTQLKAEKRHRDQQRKAKLSENRKHLTTVRVVQRNLVFVVGLPVRLADPELLKKHEYFGKFGKIHKVVINQSTSYAGSQGPSASAYVTYMKSDDALRAIQSVNNITIDGRLLKSSLGTTKYCSHFMKNQPCPKADCMYLHDFGDPEASFTKEQMHAGKHQEYEKKLHEALLSRKNTTPPPACVIAGGAEPKRTTTPPAQAQDSNNTTVTTTQQTVKKEGRTTKEGTPPGGNASNKEVGWPNLDKNNDKTEKPNNRDRSRSNKSKSKNTHGPREGATTTSSSNNHHNNSSVKNERPLSETAHITNNVKTSERNVEEKPENCDNDTVVDSILTSRYTKGEEEGEEGEREREKTLNKFGVASIDNTSFFSEAFQTTAPTLLGGASEEAERDSATPTGGDDDLLTDAFPRINTSEDWAAAFGFSNRMMGGRSATPPLLSDPLLLMEEQQRNGGGGAFRHNNAATVGVFSTGNNAPLRTSEASYFDGAKLRQVDNEEGEDDVLVPNKGRDNGYVNAAGAINQHFGGLVGKEETNPGGVNGLLNGLDQNMSKFFMDFHKNQSQMNVLNGINSLLSPPPPQQQQQPNGFYQQQQQQQHSAVQERFLLLQQQKQLEEQLMNLNMKQQQQQRLLQNYQFQQQQQQNGFMNGQSAFARHHLYAPPPGAGPMGATTPPSASKPRQPARSEDELDFDPFQETQKALAELIATENSCGGHATSGRTTQHHHNHHSNHHQQQQQHVNSLLHNNGHLTSSSSTSLPPPPPGFVQPNNNTHMNSFGSKILPFLNMSNSPTQNSWPISYSNQQKNITTNMNDWKNLDPAILSSSRHFQFANQHPQVRDQQQQQQQHNAYQTQQNMSNNCQMSNQQTSPVAAPNFPNFAHQLQPNLNGFQLNQQTSTSNGWFGTGDSFPGANMAAAVPPGFRNSQQTKQQEC